jgi:hypothetical protein
MLHEMLEETEFRWRQVNVTSAAADAIAGEIHLEVKKREQIAHLEFRRAPCLPQSGLDARDQLLRRERLCEILIGARFKQVCLMLRSAFRGEHDDRDGPGPPMEPEACAQGAGIDARHAGFEEKGIGRLVQYLVDQVVIAFGGRDIKASASEDILDE